MVIVLYVISILFGGLSLTASVSQIIKERKPIPAAIMAAGSSALIASVIFSIYARWFDFIIALFGCAAICAAAIWNGIKSKQFHIRHHIIRIALSAALVVGFAVL